MGSGADSVLKVFCNVLNVFSECLRLVSGLFQVFVLGVFYVCWCWSLVTCVLGVFVLK